jgi:hypothetical protein
MGRKRLDVDKKRKRLTLTLPAYLVDYLKSEKVIISQLVEKLLKDYLKR